MNVRILRPQMLLFCMILSFCSCCNAKAEKQYATWDYDKKNHCLTIRGNMETHDEEQTKDIGDGAEFYEPYPQVLEKPAKKADWKQREDVREVIIEPGVTAINSAAFAGFKNLEKITIPDSVNKIGNYVFYRCSSLKEITIPDRVTEIGQECFFGCESLQQLTIGKNVKNVGDGSFFQCRSLRRIKLSKGNQAFMIQKGGLYHKEKKMLYYYFGDHKKGVIAKGTKKIGTFAFGSHPKLQKITIPASVLKIGGGAFYHCEQLKEIKFDKKSSCRSIENYKVYQAFEGCKNLREIILPDSLQRINYSFSNCNSLRRIHLGKKFQGYEKGLYENNPLTFDYFCVAGSEALREITVSKQNPYFSSDQGVLYDKQKKTLLLYPAAKPVLNYKVPGSVKKIEVLSFAHCKKLRSLVIKQDLKIGVSAFRKSKKITLYGKKGSKIQVYAKKHKMKFVGI